MESMCLRLLNIKQRKSSRKIQIKNVWKIEWKMKMTWPEVASRCLNSSFFFSLPAVMWGNDAGEMVWLIIKRRKSLGFLYYFDHFILTSHISFSEKTLMTKEDVGKRGKMYEMKRLLEIFPFPLNIFNTNCVQHFKHFIQWYIPTTTTQIKI